MALFVFLFVNRIGKASPNMTLN